MLEKYRKIVIIGKHVQIIFLRFKNIQRVMMGLLLRYVTGPDVYIIKNYFIHIGVIILKHID